MRARLWPLLIALGACSPDKDAKPAPASPSGAAWFEEEAAERGLVFTWHSGHTGKYYFPGLYTAILPMIPGICAVWWMLRNRKASLREGEGEKVKMKLAA